MTDDIDPDGTRLADVLVRTGQEDRQAFRELYALTSAKLFGICLRICGERAVAEEALHHIYLTIWKCAGGWEPGRVSPAIWLATIARDRAIDWRRARGVRAPEVDAGLDIDGLGAEEADMLRSTFFHGLRYDELARREGVSVAEVKRAMRRGLAALRPRPDDMASTSPASQTTAAVP